MRRAQSDTNLKLIFALNLGINKRSFMFKLEFVIHKLFLRENYFFGTSRSYEQTKTANEINN